MARVNRFQNSFAAGEIAPEYLMRSDLQARNEALKKARNVLLLQGGGFKRRWGTVDLAGLTADAVLETLGVGEDDATLLVFMPGKFQERDLNGVLLQEVTGLPWSASDLRSMQIATERDRIVVSSRSFWPHQLTRVAGVWSPAAFAFADGLNGAKRQPYWRYADRGISISPSGYSGAVTVVASAAVFTAQHVGARIRYTGIEIAITAYTSATQVTGTVIGTLYPTLTVNVASSAGFLIGQEVSGLTSQIRGVVTAVPTGTSVRVQLVDGYTPFDATEKLASPTAVSALSGAPASFATPAPTVEWDEQMISDARGYPGACAFHRTRLLFGDFPQAKNALACSAVGDVTDFDVGEGLDTDAVIDRVGRDATLNIRHFGSTEQLLILTEAGPHYIPEQVAAPLSATNMELQKIGPEAAGDAPPVLVAEGLLFTEARSGRLMAAVPTGNVRRSWDISDLAELSFHLMGTPVEIELLAASTESDRLVCLLRDDGKIAVLAFRRGGQFSAWSLWETTGEWRSLTATAGKLFAVSKRTVAGSPVYRLERFDPAVYGDGVVRKPAGNAGHMNGATCGVWIGPNKVGEYPVAAGAASGLASDLAAGAHQIGFDFAPVAEVVPPVDGQSGLGRKIRIPRVWLDVVGTVGVKVNGYDPTGFPQGEGVGGAVPALSGQLLFYLFGRSRDATLTITQGAGGPLEVRSLTMEVTN